MTLTIQDLISTLSEERKKSKPGDDEDFLVVQQLNQEWPSIFRTYFLSKTTRLPQIATGATSDDDLVFYVTNKIDDNSQIKVFRHHDEKRQPKPGAVDYDWEETTYLNLVLHQFEYTVTTAVCIKTNDKRLQILKRLSTRVYASPSRRDMENKGSEEKITYPKLYFTVDNFEETFCEMFVNEGQMVCVELVAKNPVLNTSRVLFLGSIKYEALRKVYETRETTSTRVAQRVSLGIYTKRRVEFVRMRGPNGKGHAEMAVSRYRSSQSGTSTPDSTPSTPVKSNFDEENEDSLPREAATPPASQGTNTSNAATPEVESTDIRQELSDNSAGFLGRTFNQAISWVRNSNVRLDASVQTPPLQTCLTYLTLPCDTIIKDLLESNSTPLLTPQ
ncbi:unnamed protein product [Adineta ricciae]|uniref:Uncharacterized protein n=1 Tax=Adineta ricciae TaxID=249248 RepID=A0A815K3E9_ADIRI|nr:unnamed protein product [Adineta ricciae]